MDDPNWPWDALAAAGACATAIIAFWQINSLKRQQRGWETLKACERYDIDPILDRALKDLRNLRDGKDKIKNWRDLRLEVTTVLNYLENLATGIEQGFYNPRVVRDHMETIVRDHLREFLEPEMAKSLEINPDDFARIAALKIKWDSQKPSYRH